MKKSKLPIIRIKNPDGSFTDVPGIAGKSGGYYKLEITQIDNGHVAINLIPSDAKMEEIPQQIIELPKGEKGDSGVHVGNTTPPEGTKVIIHPNGSTVKIPTELSELNSDENNQTVTQLEKDAWNDKQPKGDYVTSTDVETAVSPKADLTYINNTFANAIRETLTGEVIATDMVSPVEHEVECRIRSQNIVFPNQRGKQGWY